VEGTVREVKRRVPSSVCVKAYSVFKTVGEVSFTKCHCKDVCLFIVYCCKSTCETSRVNDITVGQKGTRL